MFRKIGPIYKKIYQDKKWLTISNGLTLIRILIIPFIVIGIFYEKWFDVFALFVLAGITDLLDGYFARLLNQTTHLGKILDPLADKLLIISSFASLAFIDSPSFIIPKWFVFFVLFREIFILLGSYIILRLIGLDFDINPTIWGKMTTFLQLTFILWLFICYFFEWAPARTYDFLLIGLTLFSFMALLNYIYIGLDYIKKKN